MTAAGPALVHPHLKKLRPPRVAEKLLLKLRREALQGMKAAEEGEQSDQTLMTRR